MEDFHYATDNSKTMAYKLNNIDQGLLNKSEGRASKPLQSAARISKKSPANGRISKFNIKNLSLT